MIISDFAIKRPVATVVTMVALVIFGIFALTKLEVDEFPAIDAPVVTVLIPYPGAAPDQVERDVVDPLEEQFMRTVGDRRSAFEVGGRLRHDHGHLPLQHQRRPGHAGRARRALQRPRRAPPDIIDPIIQKYDPTARPIVSLVLQSTALTTPELTQIADPGDHA